MWSVPLRFLCSLKLPDVCPGSAALRHHYIKNSVSSYRTLVLFLMFELGHFSWTLSRLVHNLLASVHPRGQDSAANPIPGCWNCPFNQCLKTEIDILLNTRCLQRLYGCSEAHQTCLLFVSRALLRRAASRTLPGLPFNWFTAVAYCKS